MRPWGVLLFVIIGLALLSVAIVWEKSPLVVSSPSSTRAQLSAVAQNCQRRNLPASACLQECQRHRIVGADLMTGTALQP